MKRMIRLSVRVPIAMEKWLKHQEENGDGLSISDIIREAIRMQMDNHKNKVD